MSDLYKLMQDAIDRADALAEDTDIAEYLAAALGKRYRELTFHLLVREVCRFRRNITRGLEELVPMGVDLAIGKTCAERTTRRELLEERLLVPGRPPVTWGSATIEDHQARIDYLTKFRDGIDATIQRHADAIQTIMAAKVRCLADLESEDREAMVA